MYDCYYKAAGISINFGVNPVTLAVSKTLNCTLKRRACLLLLHTFILLKAVHSSSFPPIKPIPFGNISCLRTQLGGKITLKHPSQCIPYIQTRENTGNAAIMLNFHTTPIRAADPVNLRVVCVVLFTINLLVQPTI